ncbi:MAG: GPR1/FUN34/YaaH family transporter [Actinomycetota bacterium]|nr:GPR1/FUN34/YaaH family transporter [Actinomycetota bacterium]
MTQRDSQPRIEDVTRIVLRPLASPLPLGFFAFGIGSILLSALQFGLIPQADVQNLALLFGVFVFPLEILAALLAYFARESVGATILSIIAFSWLGTAVVTLTSAPDVSSPTIGFLYLSIALILMLLGMVGVFGKPLLATVMFLAFFRYGLNGIYELTSSAGLQTASGIIGCLIFALSLYGGLALALEDVQHRTVLPFGRRGEARDAIEGDLGNQVGPVGKEAGVRKQL